MGFTENIRKRAINVLDKTYLRIPNRSYLYQGGVHHAQRWFYISHYYNYITRTCTRTLHIFYARVYVYNIMMTTMMAPVHPFLQFVYIICFSTPRFRRSLLRHVIDQRFIGAPLQCGHRGKSVVRPMCIYCEYIIIIPYIYMFYTTCTICIQCERDSLQCIA